MVGLRWGVAENKSGYPFGASYTRDYSIVGDIKGTPPVLEIMRSYGLGMLGAGGCMSRLRL